MNSNHLLLNSTRNCFHEIFSSERKFHVFQKCAVSPSCRLSAECFEFYNFRSLSGLEDNDTGPDKIVILENSSTTAKTTTATTSTTTENGFKDLEEWAGFGSFEDDEMSISDISKNDPKHVTKKTSTSTIKTESSSKINLIIWFGH